MNIKIFEDYNTMSTYGASIVLEEIKKKPNILLCAATGNSPLGLYSEIVDHFKRKEELFCNLRTIKLDEWLGLEKGAKGTCEQYLRNHVIKPLDISEDRYFSFDANASDPKTECKRIQSHLEKNGPIDVCLLGLGKNGHLGLNEPGEYITPTCHVAKLTTISQQHNMIEEGDVKPKYGMTLGMGDILSSKRIILLISGEGKREAKDRLLSGKVTARQAGIISMASFECRLLDSALVS